MDLENTNEEFVHNKDEANRLRTTLSMMYLLGALAAAVALIAGLFWIFTQDTLPVILIGLCAVLLGIVGVVVHKNRPRAMRLASVHKALNDLVSELVFHAGYPNADGVLMMGTPANGMLEATMIDVAEQLWSVKAIAPVGMTEGAPRRVAFDVTLTRTALRSAATGKLMPLTHINLRMVGAATQLIKATSSLTCASTDLMAAKQSVEDETAAAVESLGFRS